MVLRLESLMRTLLSIEDIALGEKVLKSIMKTSAPEAYLSHIIGSCMLPMRYGMS